MTKSEYYYGVKWTEWENLKYFDAIEKRANYAKNLYIKLEKELNDKRNILSEDEMYNLRKRKYKVYNAWKDNEKLIDEKESYKD